MHVLRLTSPVNLPDGTTFDAGEWLVQDDNAFQLALMAERGTCKLETFRNPGKCERLGDGTVTWSSGVMDPAPKSILLIRSGAIGDLLLLTPAIRELRKKYPDAQIWLCCHKRHWDIFAQGDTHFVEYPIPVSELTQFDLIIPLENIVELSTEKGVHATDAFAEALGVTVVDYRPVYRVAEPDSIGIDSIFPKTKPRIALQLHSSAAIRNYPMQQWLSVIQKLIERGWEVMLMGKQDGIKGGPPALKDCSSLSFREAAAVIATCDVFCGVDSAFFNLCPALGVPAVGLFGPVDWRTRVKEGNGQVALHGEASCAPCGWTNSRNGRRFPDGGPCNGSGRCEPLASVSPSRVIAVIEREAKK